jgi:predicted dehydrogenase
MSQRVGLVGCGNIAEIYLVNSKRFTSFDIVACADRDSTLAQAKAVSHDIRAVDVTELLADPSIDIILNLTPPKAHAEVCLAALARGKHVYTEKPLAVSVREALEIVERARERGLRLGSAPDTMLGANVQTAARLLEAGELGRPIFGAAGVLSHGMEHWLGNPRAFYEIGGGPVLDMGPYYVAALVTLLGPARRAQAVGCIGNATRTVSAPGSPWLGQSFAPEVLTTVSGVLEFTSGVHVSLVASWDAWAHGHPTMELQGQKGALRLANPNWFGGSVGVARGFEGWRDTPTDHQVFGRPNWTASGQRVANYRGLGLAQMAAAIEAGQPHMASAEFSLHVLQALLAFYEAGQTGRAVAVPEAAFALPRLSEEAARQLWQEPPFLQ